MAESAAYSRRGIKGGSKLAHLSSTIGSSTTGVVSLDDLATWVNLTANGPARLMINRGGSTAEEIEISAVSGNNITIVAGGRGLGGTTAASHDAGETVEVVSSPRDFDEANALVAQTLGAMTGNALEVLRVNAGATALETAPLTGTMVANTPAGGIAATTVQAAINELDTEKAAASALTSYVAKATFPVTIGIAIGDETTAIEVGTAKTTFRMPHAMTLTAVRASLTTASSSGIPTFDINEGGTTILSTKLTIDANEKTSTTAATAAVISDSALADDAEITIDVDVAGTGAAGAKIWLIGTRVAP